MALKITKTMDNGITVNDAYVKIVSCGTNKGSANIKVAFYVNQNQEKSFYEHIYVFTPDMTDNGVNIWKQGYEYLKNHPDFEGAEDILEDGQQA